MSEYIKDSELISEDPPFHSSTSPGAPIPSDLRVAGFDKRKIIATLTDVSEEMLGERTLNDSKNSTSGQEISKSKE